MSGLSMEQVEREYAAWERAAMEHMGAIPVPGTWIATAGMLTAVLGDGSDLPDDYGIEYAEDEQLVHTGWACGFVEPESEVTL